MNDTIKYIRPYHTQMSKKEVIIILNKWVTKSVLKESYSWDWGLKFPFLEEKIVIIKYIPLQLSNVLETQKINI